jgi:hypothetical protein
MPHFWHSWRRQGVCWEHHHQKGANVLAAFPFLVRRTNWRRPGATDSANHSPCSANFGVFFAEGWAEKGTNFVVELGADLENKLGRMKNE